MFQVPSIVRHIGVLVLGVAFLVLEAAPRLRV